MARGPGGGGYAGRPPARGLPPLPLIPLDLRSEPLGLLLRRNDKPGPAERGEVPGSAHLAEDEESGALVEGFPVLEGELEDVGDQLGGESSSGRFGRHRKIEQLEEEDQRRRKNFEKLLPPTTSPAQMFSSSLASRSTGRSSSYGPLPDPSQCAAPLPPLSPSPWPSLTPLLNRSTSSEMSTPQTAIDSLAPETMKRIMELVRDPIPLWKTLVRCRLEQRWSTLSSAPLLAASLVCRKRRDPAERVLGTDLRPGSTAVAWFASPARGRYFTRELWIHVDWETVDSIVEAISACTGLKSLAVSLVDGGVSMPWTMPTSPSLAGSSVPPESQFAPPWA